MSSIYMYMCHLCTCATYVRVPPTHQCVEVCSVSRWIELLTNSMHELNAQTQFKIDFHPIWGSILPSSPVGVVIHVRHQHIQHQRTWDLTHVTWLLGSWNTWHDSWVRDSTHQTPNIALCIRVSHVTHVLLCSTIHRNESCHTYERVMSHIWTNIHRNESCHTYEWVMSHVWAFYL